MEENVAEVVLVRPEKAPSPDEPTQPEPAAHTSKPRQKLKQCTLPNGIRVSYPSTKEEIFKVYEETYVERQYLQHGVELKEGSTVIDVGANTGIFSMFAAEVVGPSGRVISLEPSPAAHACCEANVRSHAAWCQALGALRPAPVEVVKAAAGDGSSGTLMLVVYDRASTISSIIPDSVEAHRGVQVFIETRMREGKAMGNMLERVLTKAGHHLIKAPLTAPVVRGLVHLYVRRMLSSRREVPCRVVTVSELLRDRGISCVSLLKVDVERAELQVLQGVEQEDWGRIQQVAVEVHEPLKDQVTELLRGAGGFTSIVTVPADPAVGPGLFNIHATRLGPALEQAAQA